MNTYPQNTQTRWPRWIIALWIGMLLPLIPLPGQAAPLTIAKEYQIKAAFLFNFVNFFRWPDKALGNPDALFRICVFGQDPFQVTLDVAVENEKAQGHPIAILRTSEPADIPQCQILYISASEQARVGDLLKAVQGLPVLTVSDLPNFTESGGMVKFFEDKQKIRLAMVPQAINESGLDVSAKLLKISEIVNR